MYAALPTGGGSKAVVVCQTHALSHAESSISLKQRMYSVLPIGGGSKAVVVCQKDVLSHSKINFLQGMHVFCAPYGGWI